MAIVTPTPNATRYPTPTRGSSDHRHGHQGDHGAGPGQSVGQADQGHAATVVVVVPVRTGVVVVGRSVGPSVRRSVSDGRAGAYAGGDGPHAPAPDERVSSGRAERPEPERRPASRRPPLRRTGSSARARDAGGEQHAAQQRARPGNARRPTGVRSPRRWPAAGGGSRTSVTASMWSISSACRKPSTRAVASVASRRSEPGEFEAPNMTASAPIRLTSFSHGAGCACKLGSADLSQGPERTSRARRGATSWWTPRPATTPRWSSIAPDRALIATVDFFTPIVDNPRDWGAIAAANAVSDIYAMGGQPLFALNLVGWPREKLPFELLGLVLDGAAEILERAGCPAVGGHSIDDPEPKFGLAVIGEAHPDRLLTNAGGHAGDVLLLTKPLGTGILTTALKRDEIDEAGLAEAVRVMTTLNDKAAAKWRSTHGATTATDVTGLRTARSPEQHPARERRRRAARCRQPADPGRRARAGRTRRGAGRDETESRGGRGAVGRRCRGAGSLAPGGCADLGRPPLRRARRPRQGGPRGARSRRDSGGADRRLLTAEPGIRVERSLRSLMAALPVAIAHLDESCLGNGREGAITRGRRRRWWKRGPAARCRAATCSSARPTPPTTGWRSPVPSACCSSCPGRGSGFAPCWCRIPSTWCAGCASGCRDGSRGAGPGRPGRSRTWRSGRRWWPPRPTTRSSSPGSAGHNGHPKNEFVDYLAVRAAREQLTSDGLVESGFDGLAREGAGTEPLLRL